MLHAQLKPTFDLIAAAVDRWAKTNWCVWLIFLFNLLLLFLLLYPHSVYIRTYPQDVFGFLDGIYRTASGQIPNRDFFDPLGALFYALPALFVQFGANPLLSLAYAQTALLVLNLFVAVYLLNTRIPGIPGLLFALVTSLLLAARMNLGEDMRFVTFAMNYNRYCTVFLSEILIFFIPAKDNHRMMAIIDIVIMSVLSLILFYTKMTYFAVAVAALALLSLTSWTNARRVIAVLVIFVIAVTGIEMAYGFLRGYFAALFMAGRASGAIRGTTKSLLGLVETNLPELIVCYMLPISMIYMLGLLQFFDLIIFSFVAVASLALLNQNAQISVLIVPFTLLFIALDIIDRRTESNTRAIASRGLLYAIIMVMSFRYSYPLVLNGAVSFVKSISGIQPIGTDRITARFLVDWDELDPQLLRDLMRENVSPFDIFSRARRWQAVNNIPWMKLSAAEVATSIEDGVKAARDYCGANARILSADQVNPFPAILDLPPAGRMIFVVPDREMSRRNYLPTDQMFTDVTCIMVPKLPIDYAARETIFWLYGEYIKRQFTLIGKTNYWVVYTRNERRGSGLAN